MILLREGYCTYFIQASDATSTETEGGEAKDKNDDSPEFVYKSLSFEEMAGDNFTKCSFVVTR